MSISNFKYYGIGCLLGLFGMAQPAAAQSIQIFSSSGSSNTLPTNIPFTLLNLGTGTANSEITTNTLTATSTPVQLPTGSEISQIAFGTSTTSGNTPSAVFAGGVSGLAASPFGSSNTTSNFLVAGGYGGSVTVSYSVTQVALELLWGSVDSTSTNNLLTFKNASGTTIGTVSGAQIAAAVGSSLVTGTTNVAVRIYGLTGYNTLVVTNPSTPAFEFVLGAPVSEPGALAVFAVAIAGFGFIRQRNKSRAAIAA